MPAQQDPDNDADPPNTGTPTTGPQAPASGAAFQPLGLPSTPPCGPTRYTYVEYVTGERQLYDVRADPDQLHNIVSTADPKLVQDLAKQLSALQKCKGSGCRVADRGSRRVSCGFASPRSGWQSWLSMSPVLSPAPPQAAPTRLGRNVAAVVVGGVVGLALIFGGAQALEGPDVINRVVIDNPTPYPVEVAVAGSDGGSVLTLGPVSSGERHAFASVVDQGDQWVVHATSARTDGGTFVVRRADVERTNWVITIPDSVTSKLAANGASAPERADGERPPYEKWVCGRCWRSPSMTRSTFSL